MHCWRLTVPLAVALDEVVEACYGVWAHSKGVKELLMAPKGVGWELSCCLDYRLLGRGSRAA